MASGEGKENMGSTERDDGGAVDTEECSNKDLMKAITCLKKSLHDKIDSLQAAMTDIKKDVGDCKDRINEAEKRISDVEDDGRAQTIKVTTLENTVKKLSAEIESLQSRSRRNNVRLTGFGDKEGGRDLVVFMEKWIPDFLGIGPVTIERAHRIPGDNVKRSAAQAAYPRTVIMKFLNFRDRDNVLNAAKNKGKLMYKERQVQFRPDLPASLHKKQMEYNDVRQQLRDKGIQKHRVIFPSRLLVTHGEESHTFDNPEAVKRFIQDLDSGPAEGT